MMRMLKLVVTLKRLQIVVAFYFYVIPMKMGIQVTLPAYTYKIFYIYTVLSKKRKLCLDSRFRFLLKNNLISFSFWVQDECFAWPVRRSFSEV